MREWLGTQVGRMAAPLVRFGSTARNARILHPEGVVGLAEVRSVGNQQALARIGGRLAGYALMRFSTALWRGGKEWIDALGIGIRLRRSPEVTAVPGDDDQDLLVATIRSPFTTLVAPLKTHVHHFLDNDFYGAAPFDVDGYGRAKLRLVSRRAPPHGDSRQAKLEDAVARGNAVFTLQLRRVGPWTAWEEVAELRVRRLVDVDQRALRFWPFRNGLGLYPRGFVHALRRGTYRGSQAARPASERSRLEREHPRRRPEAEPLSHAAPPRTPGTREAAPDESSPTFH